MNVAIRVDASNQMGTGHAMRCLTLANTLKQRGASVRFISRALPEYFRLRLTTAGHQLVMLGTNDEPPVQHDLAHSGWLGTSQVTDALATIRALENQTWNWLVVDHYALDSRWEQMLRQSAARIIVIDDIADRDHDCDVLIDHNHYVDPRSRYAARVPAHCLLLLGPRYAMLRDEFRKLRTRSQPRSGPAKNILVCFGGVDAQNYTGCVLECLKDIRTEDVRVDVVIGSQHPYREQLLARCMELRFYSHVQADNMAELMSAADCAFGAGGVTTWERCCVGLPTLAVCAATNQSDQLGAAAREGWLCAPFLDAGWPDGIEKHIRSFLENDNLRSCISGKAMAAVDGKGAPRLARAMGCTGIMVRPAVLGDSRNIFNWRNHPAVRRVSNNADIIDWDAHQKWFNDVLTSPQRSLLIGYADEAPVGVLRFDKHIDEAEVSIYLVPDAGNSGRGEDLLCEGEQWVRRNMPGIKRFRARVLGDNIPSHRLFQATGYQTDATHYVKNI